MRYTFTIEAKVDAQDELALLEKINKTDIKVNIGYNAKVVKVEKTPFASLWTEEIDLTKKKKDNNEIEKE